MARARGLSRCRKFESIIEGTVDRCDFSADTNSDESVGGYDTGETEEDEEDDDTDETGEDEEDDEDDEDEYEENEEPSRKREELQTTMFRPPSNIRTVRFHSHYSFRSRRRWIQKSSFARSFPILPKDWKSSILIQKRFTLFIMCLMSLTKSRDPHHEMDITREKHSTKL